MTATPFWRDLATRAVRNAVQVALPFLALVAGGQITKAGALAVTAAAGLAGEVLRSCRTRH